MAEGDLSWLRQQYHDFADEWRKPSEVTHLKVQRLLIGLELLLLDRLGFQPKLLSTGRDQQRVERVLYWYRQNLHLNPTVADIARVMGVSSVHLRRLFINVSNASPKNVLQDIRMRCIHDYLQNPESTVEGAAAEFGYADASSLTRAYRQCFGHSPRKQR
ncbi:MAG: AraC family transcriptional regulator [Verrucomicrobia bacterium]|nr:AraC family transcriptional regulator [Verrucomicrobiota bacterium]